MAHEYWRVWIPDNAGSTYTVAVGVEMRESIGGPNTVAGGTAFAGSEILPDLVAAKAFLPWSSDASSSGAYWSCEQYAPFQDRWFAYQFPAPVEIEEITLTGVREAKRCAALVRLEYSDDGVTWTRKYSWAPALPWTLGGVDTRVLNSTNTTAATAEIRDYSARIMAAIRIPSPQLSATMFRGMVTIGYPAQSLDASHASINVTFRQDAITLRATRGAIMAAVRGRVANPRVRAWTFTLDGHDFYVLRLGDFETLIYDVSSEQWVDWDSFELPFWRPNTGMTWIGGQALAHEYGSNIVVGDDTWGLLWFLDPEQPFDEHPDYLNGAQEIPFERVVTAQVPMRGREVLPCYAVFLTGDNYGISANDFVPFVKLEYSDDAGKTYDDAGTLNVTLDTVEPCYEWLSLGQIGAPGRLFKITDNGVFARIDSMNMNDEEDGG